MVEADRESMKRGLSTKYGQFPRHADPSGKKEKRSKNDGRPPDTNRRLFSGKTSKKGKAPASKKKTPAPPPSPEAEEPVRGHIGANWNFTWDGVEMKNTCPLDTFLTMLVVPVWGGAMVQNYLQPTDPTSLISRTWVKMSQENWDEARILWMTEWLQLDVSQPQNLFSNITEMFAQMGKVSPLAQAYEMKYDFQQVCCQPKCAGQGLAPPGGVAEGEDGGEVSDNGKRVITTNRRKMSHMVIEGWTFPQALEFEHGEKVFDNHCARMGCHGPSMRLASVVTKWPTMMVFDCPSHMLNELPFTFVWRKKKFVLRGVALNAQDVHWFAIFRMPNGWMTYDGMLYPHFRFHPLDKWSEAMRGYKLSVAMFEVLDSSVEEDFGNPNIDWTTCFDGREECGFGTEETIEQENKKPKAKKLKTTNTKETGKKPKDFLDKLLKEDLKKPVQKTARESRISSGWSYSGRKKRSGPLAKCTGCRKTISREDHRLRHRVKLKKNHQHATVCQFHIKSECIWKAGIIHVKPFLEKKWSQALVKVVRDELEHEWIGSDSD